MTDKVIVTNLTALKEKYKGNAFKAIQTAVNELIAADKVRGLTTILVPLDDPKAMKKLKATPVKNPSSCRQNKKAIDGIYQALVPDYMMILGAIDVIPHQDMKNPLFSDDPEGDDEKFAWGDLPYACDAPYSQEILDFSGPSRVVGRLPDLTGQTDPDYLVGLLKTASTWKSSPKSEYQSYLGISAEKWKESTAESITNIFSSSDDLQTSPKEGYKWKSDFINRRMHFINCHGGDTYPDFLGQSSTDDEDMPVSHQAAFLGKKGRVVEGTVVAAECCFGGQLYDPTAADKGQMGMCNTYLGMKAYGFLGSTTTAYGPFSGNDQADLICQFFLRRVLDGASLGRAALEARQRFVERTSPLSPMNQKTLAQFNLYGDPSVVPVSTATSTLVVAPKVTTLGLAAKSLSKSKAEAKAVEIAGAAERADRRETLRAKGDLLSRLQPDMNKTETITSAQAKSSLKKIMSQLNLRPLKDSFSFNVQSQSTAPLMAKNAMAKGISKAIAAKKQTTTAFHVMFGRPADTETEAIAKGPGSKSMTLAATGTKSAAKSAAKSAKKSPIRKFVVLEAKEVDGKIVSVKEAHSK